MKQILQIGILWFGIINISAQGNSDPFNLLISSRVDTSLADVKSVIQLYENYYKSNPESIYDNPFWNKKEKDLYEDFDFSRVSIFQGGIDAKALFKYFTPFVMSVESIDEKYQIRVLFSSPTTDPQYAGSKVWCIQKLNAVKENNQWVLENLVVELSKKWSSKKVGFINYIFPQNHVFNDQNAALGKVFCNDIIQRFNPSYNGSFNYYITSSKDDMGLLENFDYYFVGVTTGKAREGMVLTAKGNEHYPHEFVHKLLPDNPNRGQLIEEGLAVFLGTKVNTYDYEYLMNKLAIDLKSNSEKVTFKSVIAQTLEFNGYQTEYPAGAGICELIYNLKGDDGLKQLMLSDTKNYDAIIQTVSSITGLSAQEIELEWKKIIGKYRA